VNGLKKLLWIALALLLLAAGGCDKREKVKPPESIDTKIEKEEHISIITTNKLLYHMVKDIIRDKHTVDYMMKFEEQQWLFNYTEDSLDNISRKELFIYMGAGYEPWIPRFIEELRKGKVAITNASRGIRLLSLTRPRRYRDIEFKENPYYWLNPEDYKVALANIKNSVQEKDPKNREFYEANFNESVKEVDVYLKELKTIGEEVKKYTFVVVGDELDYMIKFLGLKYIKLDEQDYPAVDWNRLSKRNEDTDELVFLYEAEQSLEKYGDIISRLHLFPVQLMVYEFDKTYREILEFNTGSLKKLAEK
jgi:zinc/manganese transport system substrate-binding protein